MDYTVESIQVAAFDQSVIPCEECHAPERALWWALRDIYQRFRSGQINKEQGEKQKQNAMRTYERDRKEYASLKGIEMHQAKMWCNIELAAREYAIGNRTPEGDKFYEAVYGCKLKDKTGGNDGQ